MNAMYPVIKGMYQMQNIILYFQIINRTECVLLFLFYLYPFKLKKVVADRVCQKKMTKECHEGTESRVLSGHFGGNKWGQW